MASEAFRYGCRSQIKGSILVTVGVVKIAVGNPTGSCSSKLDQTLLGWCHLEVLMVRRAEAQEQLRTAQLPGAGIKSSPGARLHHLSLHHAAPS